MKVPTRGLLPALLIVVVAFATFQLVKHYGNLGEDVQLGWSAPIFFLNCVLIYLLTGLVWKYFAALHHQNRTWLDCFIDTASLNLGKYVPGKVWGLLLRGGIRNGGIELHRQTIYVSIGEQLLVLGVGLAVAGGLLAYSEYGLALPTVIMLLASVATSLVLAASKLVSMGMQSGSRVVVRSFPVLLRLGCLYLLLWLANVSGIIILALAVQDLSLHDLLVTGAVLIISMTVGWIAIFAPAGIGVREGVFALLITWFNLELDNALALILLHRVMMTVADIGFALCVGLFTAYFLRNVDAH